MRGRTNLWIAGALLLAALLPAAAPEPRCAFVMVSGWALYPPPETVVRPALADIAKSHVFGIAYGTLGVAPAIRERAKLPAEFDPNAYNRELFKAAKAQQANLWLQLRYYDNDVAVGASAPAHLSAPQILSDPAAGKAFTASAMAAVREYARAFPSGCTVILGEEETMYHAKDGGGFFWAGPKVWNDSAKLATGEHLRQSEALDQLFVTNYAAITELLTRAIKSEFPACRVGLHVGHAPLYRKIGDKTVYELTLQKLGRATPDFTFYDLYNKVSKTEAEFRTKLQERLRLLKSLGQPVYYLAQLHTTNDFGSGGGRTPSAAQLDDALEIALSAGVEGFGYYAKNAVPTACTASNRAAKGCSATEDREPLDPNVTAQNMAWESSPKRWQYGLAKLREFLSAKAK